ncbi:MAG: hemerythrin domain-containing protein [Gammaproteobacteria bacterium]|nr:hemerythrin domain-containing protein [Gammaproteobacteria bacterium]
MHALEILRNEHAILLEGLDLLDHHLAAVAGGQGLDRAFARWMLEFLREFGDDTHHAKEEGVLFVMLADRGLPGGARALAAAEAEHGFLRDRGHDMEQALAAGEVERFATAGRLLSERMRRHVDLENETLFAQAQRLLTPADDAAAVQAFGRVVRERAGVRVREHHLAAIERWRRVFDAALPAGD